MFEFRLLLEGLKYEIGDKLKCLLLSTLKLTNKVIRILCIYQR